ncbi:haloacid dehalogenase [Actinomadura craniellae]|uniref:Haloacid dehalogenase n=1 Tax=Actinomadura craniellae TaxID=2231787 RepID=A0A365H8J4_9ACTN|nr:HAD family hydrolase [Actinomadura craniellae]RAY14583.1 haloacid dehalogenase [Actinomadura craniellae]
MTEAERITLACLDLAGTTVSDSDLAETAFNEALGSLGIVAGTAAHDRAMAHIRESRGHSKIEVFRRLFPADEARARAANLSFEQSYDAAVDRFGLTPVPGAESTLERLAGAGVRVCVITGLSRRNLGRVLDTLDWWDRVDLALCPEDGGRGRPWPDLVLTAALKFRVDDVRHIAVCGDTAADMLAGRRAGASLVVGVLTGAHPRDLLHQAGATHVVDSIADLPLPTPALPH